ncbi:MAG TPA: hypothetical protein VGS19_21440 [Streptosporangiaceae bacterium]|nr:hypothetical protein [Streptosporangiaceae bacterium]
MRTNPEATARRTYLASAMWMPGVLALIAAGLFWLIDGVMVLLGCMDTCDQPGMQWLSTGADAQGYLALAAVVALAISAIEPRWRRGAARAAWAVLAAEAGWFVLTAILAG